MIPFPQEHQVLTVAFAGDWHGDWAFARDMLSKYTPQVDVFVHTGDFGFEPTWVETINYLAEEHATLILAVDGNHENHPWLCSLPVSEDGVRRVQERVWHLPRGFRWRWSGVDFLALGGAYSVNRKGGHEGIDWWPEECITLADFWRAAEGGLVDIMVTHDCPAGVFIPSIASTDENKRTWPHDDLAAAAAHREILAGVVAEVQPRHLWHGHYHDRYEGELIHGGGRKTAVHGLSRNGDAESNVMVVNLLLDL